MLPKLQTSDQICLQKMDELARLIRQAQCDDKAVVAKLVGVRRHIEAL